jgi:serine/threonine protein phosphatase PrpC
MSTHSFCSRCFWEASGLRRSLLPGLFMALLLALAPFSRVSATSTQRLFAAPPAQQNVARAGVSIVRLVASYTTTVGKPGQQPVVVQCTGLGVLVASWPSQTGNDQNNWILTDGALVDGSLLKNAGSLPCDTASGSARLSALDLFLSAAYHPDEPAIHIGSTGLPGEIICQNTADCSKGMALFSFNYDFQLPYVDLASDTPALQGIGLTQNANSSVTPPSVNPNQRQSPLYVQKTAGAFLTPHAIASTDPAIEPGTPLLDAAGSLVSMHLMRVNTLATDDIRSFIQAQSALQQVPQNLVHDNWDKGITAFYQQHNYTQAHNAFQQIVATNAQFQGANDFAQFALAQQNAARVAASNTPTGGVKFQNFLLPYWILSIIVLVLLVVLLLLTTLFFGRSYQHRRRFKKEVDEANRQATIEAQRIKEIEISQRDAMAQQPTLLPVEPVSTTLVAAVPRSGHLEAEQHCPRCNEPVAPGSKFCPNCRFSLLAAESNVNASASSNRRNSGLLAAFPAQSRSAIADQPTLDMSSGTLPGDSVVDPERTEPHIKHSQSPYPVLMIVTRTNPGIKRQYKPNEDNLFAGQVVRELNGELIPLGLLVVADGMGGHANGQDASRIAIQTIANYILPQLLKGGSLPSEGYKQLILDGVQRANQAVHQGNVDSHGDMGTTMTGALIVGKVAYVANVGDSRTYLYREGEGLSKITQDHSVVASLVSAGIIKPDDIYTHPKRNQIYRSLGERENVEIDPFVVQLQPDDKLLLCSDGLWDMVRDPLIEEVIKQNAPDLDKTADGLIQAALDGGGEDNVSVIVAHITSAAASPVKTGFQLIYKPDSVQLADFG